MPAFEKAIRTIREYLEGLEQDPGLAWAHLVGTGPVKELENRLCAHYHMPFAVATSNATAGLLGVGLAAGLRGAEFITTPLTYGGTLAAWLLLGARPVFADVDPRTLTLDPDSVRRKVTRRTRAILAADVLGIPCDTQALREVADELGLLYVGDAAQSLGASISGLPASSRAHVLVTSFTAGKPVFAGEGGAVVTEDRDLYRKVVFWTQHPYRHRRELGLEVENEFGINGRPHPLGAAWAVAVFEDALAELREHQSACFRILEAAERTGLVEPVLAAWTEKGLVPSFRRVPVLARRGVESRRLVEALEKARVPVAVGPCPVRLVYRQAAFRRLCGRQRGSRVSCPVAERVAGVIVCLLPRRAVNGCEKGVASVRSDPLGRGKHRGVACGGMGG
jgi:dTDP-4-amino-4,6-dideoxygalactose transaminase